MYEHLKVLDFVQFTTASLTLELYDVIFYVIILYKKDNFIHFFIAKNVE